MTTDALFEGQRCAILAMFLSSHNSIYIHKVAPALFMNPAQDFKPSLLDSASWETVSFQFTDLRLHNFISACNTLCLLANELKIQVGDKTLGSQPNLWGTEQLVCRHWLKVSFAVQVFKEMVMAFTNHFPHHTCLWVP